MKVSGYQLRESLRRWKDRRDIFSRNFEESLWQFSDDEKGHPVDRAKGYAEADRAVARLESAQQEYNLKTTIQLPNESVTLSVAVKLLGGAGRLTRMWRKGATDTGRDKYSYRENRRSKEDEFARRMVPQELAMQKADEAACYASALRAGIAEANGTSLDIEQLDPKLLS